MRRARLHIPGLVHHLIWRCLNREWLITSDQHRERYLWWLGRALEESDWKCIAYAVMSNHVHIAAVAGEEPLARWSRRAHTPFAIWANKATDRLGPFFAGRAADFALGPIAATFTLAYIHNNPVRARVVERARDSTWTSHRAYIGLAAVPRWLHVDEGLLRSGQVSTEDFERLVDGQPIPEHRPASNRAARALARAGQIVEATPRDAETPLLMRQFGRLRPNPGRLLLHAAHMLDLDPAAVASRRRHPRLRDARLVIAHSGRALGLTGGDIADALGLSQQAVSLMLRHGRPHPDACRLLCERLASEVRLADAAANL
ncbi:MAG: transposase [Kofleriaceae bacterium]